MDVLVDAFAYYAAEMLVGLLLFILAGVIAKVKKTLNEWGIQGDIGYEALLFAENLLESFARVTKNLYPELQDTVRDMGYIAELMRAVWEDPNGSREELFELFEKFKGLYNQAKDQMDKGLS